MSSCDVWAPETVSVQGPAKSGPSVCRCTMWLVFLDEFGHDGAYVSRDHPRFNQSPVFGLGGLALREHSAIDFALDFGRLKANTLGWPYRYREAKGRTIFKAGAFDDSLGSSRRHHTANVANRFLSLVRKHEGHVLYRGIVKASDIADHSASKVHMACLRRVFATVNSYCGESESYFLMSFDRHETHLKKMQFISGAHRDSDGKVRIADYPHDLESRYHNSIQAADWVCALLGRVWAYRVDAVGWASHKPYDDRFSNLLTQVTLPGSTVQ